MPTGVMKASTCGHQYLVRVTCSRSRSGHQQLRRRATAVSASLTAQEVEQRLRNKRPINQEDLHNPAHIAGRSQQSVQVQDHDNLLEAYMSLPTEEYFELMPNMIKPLGGNKFALAVPRVHLLNVWLEPLCEVRAVTQPGAVVVEATKCHLAASELIEALGLDDRFSLRFVARLTWTPSQAWQQARGGSTGPPGQGQPAGQQPGTPGAHDMGIMHGDASLDVWSEVLPPFSLMPRSALEGAGNMALDQLVARLLPPFMERLKADFEHWATSRAYRERRAAGGRRMLTGAQAGVA